MNRKKSPTDLIARVKLLLYLVWAEGYHNQHFEFKKYSVGNCPEQILLEGTDTKSVNFEMDLFWAVNVDEKPKKKVFSSVSIL